MALFFLFKRSMDNWLTFWWLKFRGLSFHFMRRFDVLILILCWYFLIFDSIDLNGCFDTFPHWSERLMVLKSDGILFFDWREAFLSFLMGKWDDLIKKVLWHFGVGSLRTWLGTNEIGEIGSFYILLIDWLIKIVRYKLLFFLLDLVLLLGMFNNFLDLRFWYDFFLWHITFTDKIFNILFYFYLKFLSHSKTFFISFLNYFILFKILFFIYNTNPSQNPKFTHSYLLSHTYKSIHFSNYLPKNILIILKKSPTYSTFIYLYF